MILSGRERSSQENNISTKMNRRDRPDTSGHPVFSEGQQPHLCKPTIYGGIPTSIHLGLLSQHRYTRLQSTADTSNSLKHCGYWPTTLTEATARTRHCTSEQLHRYGPVGSVEGVGGGCHQTPPPGSHTTRAIVMLFWWLHWLKVCLFFTLRLHEFNIGDNW